MKLYHFPRAPHARKVEIFLREKGIDIPHVEVDLGKKENLGDEFLRKNPRGVVPVLELDDGTFVDESLAICRYFEHLHPQPALFGTEPQQQALIDSWERHMEFDGYIPGQDAFRNSSERFARAAVAGMTEEFRAIPELAERGKRRLEIYFDRLNARLADVSFIAGEQFSMADITGVVAVDMSRRVKMFLAPEHEHALRWYEILYERDSVSSTYIEV